MRFRSGALVAIVVVSAGLLAIAACDDDSSTAPPSTNLDSGTIGFDSSSPPTTPGNDSGELTDAGEITDGGDNPIDEDSGLPTDEDGGFDAGPACGTVAVGPYVETSCSARVPIMRGGDLTTATYQLEGVTVLGSVAFCGADGGYVPFDYRGGLDVVATSATAATFEFLEQHRRSNVAVRLPTTVRYDVAVAANGVDLTFTPQSCSHAATPRAASFTTGTNPAGKKTIVLRLAYGRSGTAIFRFAEP